MLDPRISYEGLKMDYGDNLTLSDHLEDSKTNLFEYFNDNYATLHSPTPSSPPPSTAPALDGSPQKSFTASVVPARLGLKAAALAWPEAALAW